MGFYLKRLLCITSGVVVAGVALVAMSQPGNVASVRAPAQGRAASLVGHPTAALMSVSDEKSMLATAATLGPYVVRLPDGALTVTAPAGVVDRLPASDVQALETGLQAVNARIAAGQLQATTAGAVFDPKSTGFMLQGGWSGFGQDWWHSYWCLSHSDIYRMTNWGWWTISGAGLTALTYFAAVIGLAAAVVVYLYAGWMYLADNGNGSCLNAGHWPPPNLWVTSQ
jgi:hypothetical protein